MKILIISALYLLISFPAFSQGYEKIVTQETIVTDTFFNEFIIEDSYRWIENTNSPKVKEWLEIQKNSSQNYLSKCINKSDAFALIDRYSYTEYEHPRKIGDFYYTYAYYENIGVPALFSQHSLKDERILLVDPNYISRKDRILLKGISQSKNASYLAYQFNRNGSDWHELKVISPKTGIHFSDHLTGLKFSDISWKDDGFFYSTFYQDDIFGVTQGQRVFYHKIGDEQRNDSLIFERINNPATTFDYLTTSDERFFILKERNEKTGRYNIFYIDYTSKAPVLKPLIPNLKFNLDIIDNYGNNFLAVTYYESGNGCVVEIDPSNPYKWQTIVPEQMEALLLKTIPFDDRIVLVYQLNQHPLINVYDYKGSLLYELELPIATSVTGFSGKSSDEELLFSFSSYTIPPVVYKFNIKTFKRELVERTAVTFDFNSIEYTEVNYTSSDSVLVPMIIIHDKNIKLDGSNPTILKAYGGFGVVSSPSFDPGIVYFLKKGGVFAFANIRGGGDKGVEWARAGRGKYKQNSFDDFIAAAEYLIEKKYTNSNKLAATGASNGGLVVAAASVQRPDLFRAAVPIVAPLDMIRFEKFTVGHWHIDEYGTVNDSLSFLSLKSYSPYHNIKKEVNYPSMLIVTSDNDDRVPPFHSYKFAALLQSRECQTNPIILKVEEDAGHSGASSLLNSIRTKAQVYGFIMNELEK